MLSFLKLNKSFCALNGPKSIHSHEYIEAVKEIMVHEKDFSKLYSKFYDLSNFSSDCEFLKQVTSDYLQTKYKILSG